MAETAAGAAEVVVAERGMTPGAVVVVVEEPGVAVLDGGTGVTGALVDAIWRIEPQSPAFDPGIQ